MRIVVLCFVLLLACGAAAQSADVLGSHDLSSGASAVRGNMASACLYCHAPHSGTGKGPLWGQTLSTQTYSLYSSDTAQNQPVQPVLGESSSLCLSCHDGTVAPGQMVPYGRYQITGTMSSILGTQLQSSHPFSLRLPLQDAAHLVPSLVASQTTADPAGKVKLVRGNVECTSCHDPHAMRNDPRSPTFLVRENARGALCLSCHTVQPRTVAARNNPLAQWTPSVHSTSGAQVRANSSLGGYSAVAEFACLSCHDTHTASGDKLLRNPVPALANVDTTSQSCFVCHSGGDTLMQPLTNVFADFEKRGHPFPTGANTHAATEPAVLDNNRHASCADCHNAHSAQAVAAFSPAPDIRTSQAGVTGIGTDGAVLTTPATRQFENCLRCHGPSAGKQALAVYGYLPIRAAFAGDPLNLIPQFDLTAASTHPVMRDATRRQQRSLRPAMLNLLGTTEVRAIGSRIFCTDCHNSDTNREFGGAGGNGPHGSVNDHILERRYEMSRANPGTWPAGGPGTLVANLNPNPPLGAGANGPYSLCAKCHDLESVVTPASFVHHRVHIERGFSCSACHSAHGVPAGSAAVSGDRLVNFDLNVVAPNSAGALSYANGNCALTCHMMDHTGGGPPTPRTP